MPELKLLFFGQAADPNANTPLAYDWLTEAGRTLFLNTVAYALGTLVVQRPEIQVGREGQDIVVAYKNGTLQSADAVTGAAWKDETGASPLKIQPTGTAKYFRVKGK